MADVLIKGMEMPKSCGDCELAKHFDGYNENDCPFNAFSFYDCPLVPVPPHGRLIDADEALIDADERGFDFWACDADIDSAQEFLKAQRTIIEAEEGDR